LHWTARKSSQTSSAFLSLSMNEVAENESAGLETLLEVFGMYDE
jgi:hypothetical protein